MKRISKVIALCLLLSIVVSAFAVFSFGADTTMSPNTYYDMERHVGNATGDFINGDPALIDGESSFQLLKKTSANGVTYYQHLIKGELQSDGTYKNPNDNTTVYYQAAATTGSIVIADSEKLGDKNTDFMVIDFDFSTDGTFGDYYYFMNQWLRPDGSATSANRIRDHYPRLEGGTISEAFNALSYYSAATSTPAYVTHFDETGWIDVTIVYDFRGQNYENWRGYIYLNGIYAGEINAKLKNACSFYLSRFVYDTTFNAPEETINFANYTIKNFPIDYNGDLATKVNNLGQQYYELGSFSDLGYCLDNKPSDKVATVTRVEEGKTIVKDVYNFEGLSGALIDGDAVTLYKDMVNPIIVPEGATITWDKNGRYMVDPVAVDYEEVQVVLRDLKTGKVLGVTKLDDAALGYGTISFDGTNKLADKLTNSQEGMTLTKLYDEYDRPYFQIKLGGTTAASGQEYIDNVYYPTGSVDTSIRINDRKDAEGNVVAGYEKNTDYFVMDFDISTDTTYIDKLYLHSSWYDNDWTHSGRYSSSAVYFDLRGDTNEDFYVGLHSSNTANYASGASTNKWQHITMVYDVTDAAKTDVYFYINGEYKGIKSDVDLSAAVALYFTRITILKNTAQSGQTTNIANYTVKRFDKDYTGPMAAAGALGSDTVKLSDLKDLAYCVENDYNTAPPKKEIVGIESIYNQADVKTLHTFTNKVTGNVLNYKVEKDAHERTYWTLNAPDATNIKGTEWYYQAVDNKAANYVDVAKTNYLVFDADVLAGANSFERINYNLNFLNSSYTGLSSNANSDFGYIIKDGKVGVQNNGGTVQYFAENANVWTHVTVVYDITASAGSSWRAYVYIDGEFMGDLGISSKTGAYLGYIRIEPKKAGAADATTSFANWTLTKFTDEYNGTLAADIAKGKDINEYSDLAYTLKNDMTKAPEPEEPEEPEDEKPTYVTVGLQEGLSEFGADGNLRATFLSDVTLDTTASISVSKRLLLDLNGHTFTVTNPKDVNTHNFILSGTMIVRGGSLINENKSNGNVVYISGECTSANLIFQDMKEIVLENDHPMVEQRAGSVSFYDCEDIDAKNWLLVSMRGGNYEDVSLYFENSSITATTNAVYVTNTSASQKRYGSLNNTVAFNSCDVTAGDSIVRVEGAASEQGKVTDGVFVPTAGHADNNNVVTTVILNSNLVAGDAIVYSQITDIRNDAYDLDGDGTNDVIYADNFKLVTNTTIIGGTVAADYLVRQNIDANGTLPTTFSLRRSAGYLHTTNVTLDTATVNLDVAHATKSVPGAADEVNINYVGECALNTNVLSDTADIQGVSLATAGGYYLVPRSANGVLPYAVTTNVTPYPYIIDGDEYEFYWYAGDAVTTDRIPVDVTSNSPYVGFEWADELDENGAYFLETTVKVPIKANMSLSNNFDLNIYLPGDLGANSFTTVRVNGEKVKMASVTIDGVDYKALSIKDISPVNAAEAFELSFTVYTDDGLSASVTKMISILDYAEGILKNTNETTEARELIAALVNYIAKMYAAAGREDSDLAALLALDEYKAITLNSQLPTAKSTIDELGVFETVGLTAGDNFQFAFRTNAGFSGNLVFTYYKNGARFMETVMVRDAEGDGEIITLDVKAYDLLSDITIRYNGTSGEYNLAAYISELKAAEADSDIIELAEALATYSGYAAVYFASQP